MWAPLLIFLNYTHHLTQWFNQAWGWVLKVVRCILILDDMMPADRNLQIGPCLCYFSVNSYVYQKPSSILFRAAGWTFNYIHNIQQACHMLTDTARGVYISQGKCKNRNQMF